jgi:xanthine dehydrogenase accessory factor
MWWDECNELIPAMDIFEEIAKSLKEEEQIMLATIISTSGSTPAAELSKMVVRDRGLRAIGTVGGGCLEAEVLTWARSLYTAKKAKVVDFRLDEDNADSGLICGGSLSVLIEPIDRSFLPVLGKLISLRVRGKEGALVTVVKDERVAGKYFITEGQRIGGPACSTEIEGVILDSARGVITTHAVARFTEQDLEIVVEPVAGQPGLIIFGGGHVSKYLSRFASQVGFRVTIVDDRVAFANRDRFPEAAEILCDDFLSVISRLHITPNTYIAIITRGHKFDEAVLEQVIRSEAKYIGLIGSRKKILTAYAHYLEKGIPRELLERVHGPIGLDIGAVTAEEIGISIVAELIRIRRGGQEAVSPKSAGMSHLLASLGEKVERGES